MSVQAIIQVNIEIMLVILCVAIWILTKIWTNNKQKFRYIWVMDLLTAGMLVADAFAIIYRGNLTMQGYHIVRAANFFVFFFIYSITLYMIFFVEIIYEHPQEGQKRLLAAKIIAGLNMLLLFINLFVPYMYDFDEQNRYFRKGGWYINSACQVIVIIMLATVIWELRENVSAAVFWMLLSYILMPLIAAIVQIFIYGFSIVNIALGVTQLMLFMITFRYQELKIRESDMLLQEYNAKLILTQVQPHFMLNALSVVQYLCKHDSQAAAETISDLSVYLRNNMEFATRSDMIPFEKELGHIEKYIAIEKKRFGDRIKAEYDIKEKNFYIPPLSVQPLVENAIKHGISKKRGGGTVVVATYRGADAIHIIIRDDGVGFDIYKPASDDRVHMGLLMVKERLKQMCSGDMQIRSAANEGTVCEIIIPVEFNSLNGNGA